VILYLVGPVALPRLDSVPELPEQWTKSTRQRWYGLPKLSALPT
jgi:hypothetical protein